jgi:hypothetical protein
MNTIIYRKNKLFIIDKTQLKSNIKVEETCNALYAAMYEEFKGATDNSNYSNMTNLEKMSEINLFAYNWLKIRGLLK